MGLKEVVDHLQIEELLWEREGRFKEEPPEERLPWTEPSGTEDIMESTEENIELCQRRVQLRRRNDPFAKLRRFAGQYC